MQFRFSSLYDPAVVQVCLVAQHTQMEALLMLLATHVLFLLLESKCLL